MSRFSREPERLGDTLSALIRRFTHVNLSAMDQILARWPSLVGEGLAEVCRPEVVRDGVLTVRVPSGAFHTKLAPESDRLLAAFADLGDDAPRAIRFVVR